MRWWKRNEKEAELDRELHDHLELEAEEQATSGLSKDEAQFAARRALGNQALVKEEVRQAWGWMWLDRLSQDVRYAVRSLRNSPGFTAIAVLTLALGIGANTALFGVVDPLILKELPVDSPDRLVLFRDGAPDSPGTNHVSYSFFDRLRAEGTVLGAVFGISEQTATEMDFEGESDPELVRPGWVSGSYFKTLGVDAVAGRVLDDGDDRSEAERVAVISHGLWQRRFGGDPQIVGKTVSFRGVMVFTIIGVAQPDFYGVNADFNRDIWLPFEHLPGFSVMRQNAIGQAMPTRVMGRLRPGWSLEQAQAEATVIYLQMSGPGRDPSSASSVQVLPAATGFSELRFEYIEPLLVLAIASSVALLVACANLAALLLTRGAIRRRELVMRLVLGAGRSRVVGQMLMECVTLAILGGTLSLIVGYWGAHLLVGYLPAESGFLPRVGLDLRVLSFTGVVALLSVLAFGLVPAMRTAYLDPNTAPKGSSGYEGKRLQVGALNRFIVAAQVAFTLVVLVGGALFLGTLWNLRSLDTGFDRQNVIQFSVGRTSSPRSGTGNVGERLLSELPSVPGVASATYFYYGGILGVADDFTGLQVDGRVPNVDEVLEAQVFAVGPKFFEAMGIPVLQGRDFQREDLGRQPTLDYSSPNLVQEPTVDALPVAAISRNMADLLFRDQNPIGRVIRYDWRLGDGATEVEIVGVVEDTRHGLLRDSARWTLYRLRESTSTAGNLYAVRAEVDPSGLKTVVQNFVQDLDSGYRAEDIRTLGEIVEAELVRERFTARLVGLFGLLALFLASIGVYGLISYGVSQRIGEIGVRLALGARVSNIVGMLVRETVLIITTGVAIGLLSVWATTHLISSFLFGLSPTDPWAIVSAIATLLGAALIAGSIPALRASRIDPMVALRHE